MGRSQVHRTMRAIRCHAGSQGVGHAAATTLKGVWRTVVRGMGAMKRVGRAKRAGQQQRGRKSQERYLPREPAPCPVRWVPGGSGGAVEYRAAD